VVSDSHFNWTGLVDCAEALPAKTHKAASTVTMPRDAFLVLRIVI
jgi:hypothetical protein